MAHFTVRPLTAATWPAFAELVERHNGVWGGCWCMGFHPEGFGPDASAEANRAAKEQRVATGEAHAALVFDSDRCVGWCQFGSPQELPRIKHKKAYLRIVADEPDWRITCFFVDRDHRRRGVADAALEGALGEIARLGGGVVESGPEDITDRKVSASFLHNSSTALFERHGFERVHPLGKHHWLVRRAVDPA